MRAIDFIDFAFIVLLAQETPDLRELIRSCAWPADAGASNAAKRTLGEDASFRNATREQMQVLEEVLSAGPPRLPPLSEPVHRIHEIQGLLRDGRKLPILVQLPSDYDPSVSWPLLFAMHGGPVQSEGQAIGGARSMLRIWSKPADEAGWIVAAPAMLHTSLCARTVPRSERKSKALEAEHPDLVLPYDLPYEVLDATQMEDALEQLAESFRTDRNRIVATGVSLGSNFSISFACARPERFAAIVPVSTEGESRKPMLYNMQHVSCYVLEGSLDRNIRSIEGPRAFASILRSLGHDLVYQEFPKRAHEGFEEEYPEVLSWLSERMRCVHPREVLRVPHTGILPMARRAYWLECDSRQATLRARADGKQRIELTVHRADRLRIYLNDSLVNLDLPVEVWINGVKVFGETVARSIPFAMEQALDMCDPGRVYAARLDVEAPTGKDALRLGAELHESVSNSNELGQLSFWESYALLTLLERFPGLGFTAEEVDLPRPHPDSERCALRVTEVEERGPASTAGLRAGDLLVRFDGEPFYRGSAWKDLELWISRELTSKPRTYPLLVFRDGLEQALEIRLQLRDL